MSSSATSHPPRAWARDIALAVAAAFVAAALLRVAAHAGSLTPSAAPASTMRSLADIHAPLAGTFDASSVSASATGNAIQLARCAVVRIQGGSCT